MFMQSFMSIRNYLGGWACEVSHMYSCMVRKCKKFACMHHQRMVKCQMGMEHCMGTKMRFSCTCKFSCGHFWVDRHAKFPICAHAWATLIEWSIVMWLWKFELVSNKVILMSSQTFISIKGY